MFKNRIQEKKNLLPPTITVKIANEKENIKES